MKRLENKLPPSLYVYGWAMRAGHDPTLLAVVQSESDADAILAKHRPGVGAGYVFLVGGPLTSAEVVPPKTGATEP